MRQNKRGVWRLAEMKTIGITGGVGAGKSEILAYLQEHCNCCIIMADQVAKRLEEPGEICYNGIVGLLGTEVVSADGTIDKERMAQKIFADNALLQKVNQIVHPAVQQSIEERIAQERAAGHLDFLFVEAALLIECGYDKILDELWYIHTDAEVRRKRLKKARGYSDEKTARIMAGQLTEETFREHCRVVIDNSGAWEDTCRQIDKRLGDRLCQR